MLTYSESGNRAFTNAYRWTNTELIRFLQEFPEDTPIHSDLCIHVLYNDSEELFNKCWLEDKDCVFSTKDRKVQMHIVKDCDCIIYINEGIEPDSFLKCNRVLGIYKNRMTEIYDDVGFDKFINIVHDILIDGNK